MNLQEINETINRIASEWEYFKSINDRKEKEIEQKGSADPLTLEHIKKINDSIDEHKTSLERIETALARPRFNTAAMYNLSSSELKYQKAFNSYIKKGTESEISSLETKSFNDFSDAGYSITSQMSSQMSNFMESISPMLKICNVMEISTDSLELISDDSNTSASWTQDFESNSDKTDTVKIRKKSIVAHRIYAQPEISQAIIDDPRIDIEEYIVRKLSNILASKANSAFINGNGTGKPMGILSYPNGSSNSKVEQINSGIAGNYNIDSILKLFFSIDEKYAHNAKFLMSRSALQTIRMLKDKNENYIWQPSTSSGSPDTLFGAAVLQSSDMPQLKEGSLSIAFGDFSRFYTIVRRGEVKILRDNLTSKPNIKFFARTLLAEILMISLL